MECKEKYSSEYYARRSMLILFTILMIIMMMHRISIDDFVHALIFITNFFYDDIGINLCITSYHDV